MRVNRPLVSAGWILALGLAHPVVGAQPGTDFQARLAGEVVDAGGLPLAGVTVRLFVGGLPAAFSRTDSAGTFDIAFPVDLQGEETVVACAIAPRSDLVSEWAILRESGSDLDAGLWGPCVPRVGLSRSAHWPVRILNAEAVQERLAREGCLGE